MNALASRWGGAPPAAGGFAERGEQHVVPVLAAPLRVMGGNSNDAVERLTSKLLGAAAAIVVVEEQQQLFDAGW